MNPMVRATLIALAVIVLAGCATRINWQGRVGVYTFNQAVREYGPPDKSINLNDGTTVAEWMLQRGSVITTPGPYVYGPGYSGPVWPTYSSTYFPAQYVRLQFGSDGKLQTWKEFTK
jgi:hypothetical protein